MIKKLALVGLGGLGVYVLLDHSPLGALLIVGAVGWTLQELGVDLKGAIEGLWQSRKGINWKK